ncbi:glycosyltransferase family 4 protein (plasmid) [Streptomyces sp. NBC_01384]|uniref:glycosyltransferase family 4 protein n=1 Tax=Streptomyces sp. NBC_01384 TaxID=2903847 RepID=UPI002F918F66
MPPNTMDTAVLFWPRGGSAQVIRYLLRELNSRSWTTRLHAGTLGNPSDPSHAPTFYRGLDLHPYDHNDAFAAFTRGEDPQRATWPFHPSYEDRGNCPDPLFSAVPPAHADHLTRAWTRHLAAHRSPHTGLLHLHHLSHLQTSARAAYPGTPRVTTLHGTELKLIDAMAQRIRLTERAGSSPEVLAHLLHSDNPHRTTEALRLAKTAGLDDDDANLLTATAWQKWPHSAYWLTRLRQAAAHAGQLVVVSDHDQHLATRLLHLHDAPPVIPNGVDTYTFRPQHLDAAQRREHLRHWLVTDPRGWAPGGTPGTIRYTETDLRRLHTPDGHLRPLLLWTGRFLDFKRVPVLLRAFAAARTRLDPAPVLLMWGGYPGEYEGDHPAELAAELGIQQDVFFIGWRGHDELPTGLNTADLMVAPAVNEPFGMVYLEAMACGTPPIATATGGPARTITATGPHATGWLVAPDDADDLANTLVTAILDTPGRQRRGAAGRAHVQAAYSWTRTADRYLTLYDHARSH